MAGPLLFRAGATEDRVERVHFDGSEKQMIEAAIVGATIFVNAPVGHGYESDVETACYPQLPGALVTDDSRTADLDHCEVDSVLVRQNECLALVDRFMYRMTCCL